MKPFNLEEAKSGKPVQTRDGNDVEIVRFDLRGEYPILAVIKYPKADSAITFTESGKAFKDDDSYHDLFMKSEIKVGYIVLEHNDAFLSGVKPSNHVYVTVESACEVANKYGNRTVSKITWEA